MRVLSLTSAVCAIFIIHGLGLTQEPDSKTVTVTAKDIQLEVPSNWKKKEPSSPMRVAEFEIPAAKSGEEAAELVVYNFGNSTGGVRANVQRWIDQFYEDGREHEIVAGKCRDGSFTLVSISGTYKKPDGPPAAQKTIDKPNSRVIGVVLIAEMDGGTDYYFLKLAGPEKLVGEQAKALRAAIAAKADSEKTIKVDDIED